MTLIYKFIYTKKIKICLIFFCVFLCFSCKQLCDTEENIISNKTVTKKSISFNYTGTENSLNIVLENHADLPILGDWSSEATNFTFTPLLPFTEDERYAIQINNKLVDNFSIASKKSKKKTELITIFPTQDSVPENLLKMYIVFSNPMQQTGNVLDYISVQDNTIHKPVSVFLELQSELWNKEHTILTLWLDPGRIKTDLIPNKEKGLPIKKGHNYTITISDNWKDANNQSIAKSYTKTWFVKKRDNKKPVSKKWVIKNPKYDTKTALTIQFNEAMDYFLAMDCFTILDKENNSIDGEFKFLDKEKSLHFYPKSKWKKGKYIISVQTRFEDLSGNNLNHLFDIDLQSNDVINKDKEYEFIEFTVMDLNK